MSLQVIPQEALSGSDVQGSDSHELPWIHSSAFSYYIFPTISPSFSQSLTDELGSSQLSLSKC